ncbi:hypothetical protein GCM10010191_68260 [Actinomadura vinacea]|uniref:DUF4244 domain-containing protein n=2 Tax=Actinomadura vinacea TaxID=115336 RepID=A0ABP5X512_9ACTN
MRVMRMLVRPLARTAMARRWRSDARDLGMSTAEYAVGVVAAVAFAGVLLKVITSSDVKSLLMTVVKSALQSVA